MAHATYDLKWQEAMGELNEQIHIEDHTLDVEEGESAPQPPPQASILEAFQHYACLYIKYMQIFERLEQCYDQMVHPQKRIDVKQVLEVVMSRVVELKHELVKWNPPNAAIQTKVERNFPWEYVNLDDILVDLKLPPQTLEVPVPRYFKEDNTTAMKKRQRLVKGYMKLKLGVNGLFLPTANQEDSFVDALSLDEAIQIIQRNERGRQGRHRTIMIKELREEERQRRMYEAAPQSDMDPEIAAANIQRLFRGFHSRAAAVSERDDELIFIGMKPPKAQTNEIEKKLKMNAIKRKTEQAENIEGYDQALVELKETVKDEEGPSMREKMMDERRNWITEVMAGGNLPEDLSGYYAKMNPQVPEDAAEEDEADKAASKKDKDKKDKDKKGDKKKGDAKKKKAEAEEEAPPEQPPQLTGPTELTGKMWECVQQYETEWLDRDETDNFHQQHDVELAKNVVREPVEAEIRAQVDEMLILQLANIKAQLEAAAAGGKKKGKKDKKGKKGKKGGKGKKGKDKKGGKKGKALPGDKIAELKGRSTETMLAILVEQQIVYNVNDWHMHEFIGDFNYLGTIHQSAERKKGNDLWCPQDPSAAQLRQNITEYAILPLGSPFVRARTPFIRSLLLYGAEGSGKTMLASIIANETGALLLNLSVSNLVGKFPGKTDPTKLIHMVFAIGKDPTMQPVVIYIDECEAIFSSSGSSKKKGSSDGPTRFRKDLITYIASLKPEDRVLIVGTTKKPELGDPKDLKTFFDKALYVPNPDYASRVMVWKKKLAQTLKNHWNLISTGPETNPPSIPDDFDIGTLATISEGYSSGSICQAINSTLTKRRVERLEKRPLSEDEFIGGLSRTPRNYADDYQRFSDFTKVITGLDKRSAMVKQELEGDGENNNDEKGGKKGKGKKK